MAMGYGLWADRPVGRSGASTSASPVSLESPRPSTEQPIAHSPQPLAQLALRQAPNDRPDLHPAHRNPALRAPAGVQRRRERPAGAVSLRPGQPVALLGRAGAESGVDYAVAPGAGVESAARQVVCRRKAERRRQLYRPAPEGATAKQGRDHLGGRAGRPADHHVLGAAPRGRTRRQRAHGRSG